MEQSNNSIRVPFDPTMIDVDIATINLGSLIDMLDNGEINLQPDFQRSSDIWNTTKKSRLIESILLGLPLPSFYFSEDPQTKRLAVIDGLQRLCAIRDFVLEKTHPLRLKGLQFISEYDGLTYCQLGRPEIRRIQSLKITINTLRKSTPLNVQYVIFQRVNTAGEPLKAQEMRHALNQGRAADFVKELAECKEFVTATYGRISPKRMEDRDYVNRFIAFYNAFDSYDGILDVFLNDQMGLLNHLPEDELRGVSKAFKQSMETCHLLFMDNAFRRIPSLSDSYVKKWPLSKALFDAISVNIAKLSPNERKKLLAKQSELISGYRSLFDSSEFIKSISFGTSQKRNVFIRMQMVHNLIINVLKND